jgi:hypothetical protein
MGGGFFTLPGWVKFIQERVLATLPKTTDNRNGMFSAELRTLILEVIKSWQVIAMTLALILYMYLVTYVARTYHRPRSVSKARPQKAKAQPKPKKTKAKKDPAADEDVIPE